MARKIAINGFGRIGRCIVRALSERKVKDLEVVLIEGGPHAVPWTHADQVNSSLRKFLS